MPAVSDQPVARSTAAAPSAGTPCLVVVEGPDPARPAAPLGRRLTIGRGAGCDLLLPGRLVSRTHAEVEQTVDGYVLRDLGSHNGTILNGSPIATARLRHGDQIRIGEFALRAELAAGSEAQSGVVLGPTVEAPERRVLLRGEPGALQASLMSTDAGRARRARRRLDALVRISRDLTRLRELGELFPLVVDELLRVLPAERAVLLEATPGGQFEPRVARDSKDPGKQVEVSRTILDEVRTHRVCMLSSDAMFDTQFRESESIQARRIRSVLCVPIEYDKQLLGALYLDHPRREGRFTEEDLHFASGVAGIAAVAITNALAVRQARSAAQQLNHTYLSMLSVLANAIEARDHYTIGHTWRVARFAQTAARRLGWNQEKLGEIEVGGMLHDIGKIGVPDSILSKGGPLTEEEQRLMELHPQIGARMLRDVPSLQHVLPYVLHHHERYDGTGYPQGLRAAAIPAEARLLAVADALDAMTSNRPYRRGLARDAALDEIRQRAGSQFDPAVVEALLQASEAGELAPYLRVGHGSERDVICPHCSTYCTPDPPAVDAGETSCPTCKRGLRLRLEGAHLHAELI